MNALVGNKTVSALILIVLFGLAGCAGGPDTRSNPGASTGYGTGVMATDRPAVSG